MTIFDARTHLFARNSPNSAATTAERALLERDGYTMRLHHAAMITAAYPRENQSSSDLLRACFESWPRCLSTTSRSRALLPFSSVLTSVLIRISAELQRAL